jgi:hypothetical protein
VPVSRRTSCVDLAEPSRHELHDLMQFVDAGAGWASSVNAIVEAAVVGSLHGLPSL